jgi:hypothetical protein
MVPIALARGMSETAITVTASKNKIKTPMTDFTVNPSSSHHIEAHLAHIIYGTKFYANIRRSFSLVLPSTLMVK